MTHFNRCKISLSVIAALAGLQSLQSEAVVPTLANTPINQLNLVKPNLLYILDRSGSMGNTYVPDEASALNGKVGNTEPHCNLLAFDPYKSYPAPIKADGTFYPDSSVTSASPDGFLGGTAVNLTNSGFYYFTGEVTAPDFTSDPVAPATSYTPGTAPMAGYPTVYNDARCTQSATGANVGSTSPAGSATRMTYYKVGNQSSTLQQNYANWYTYYRTRLTMMKSSVGYAFQGLSDDYRIGFMTIDTTSSKMTSTASATWMPVNTFDTTQKALFFSTLYNMPLSGSTPLRQALSAAGRFFAGKYSYDPMFAHNAGGDCQQNYAIMSTDGYWNTYATNPLNCTDCTADLNGANIGNVDGPSGPAYFAPYRSYSNGTMDKNNDAGDGNHAGNLADVAMYYYATNLRPSYDQKVPQPTPSDPPFVHMNTYTIGVGVKGTLSFPSDLANIINQSKAWPVTVSNGQSTADDLWHAAVNGRGIFFSAGDPVNMQKGFASVFADISNKTIHATTSTTSSAVFSDSNNVAYKAYYQGGSWVGYLDAVLIDPTTSAELTSGGQPIVVWSGHTKLDAQASGTGWNTNRLIFVGSSTGAVPFRWASLTAAQKAVLQDGVSASADSGKGASYGQWLLNYIRGDQSNEGTSGAQYFRDRGDNKGTVGILGDVVDAKPVAIAAPKERYEETANPGYGAFKNTMSTRTPIVYVASNDGMLHAFNAETTGTGSARTATANSGKELWAYIPGLVMRNTTDESGKPDGLPAYAYAKGGVPALNKPAFVHHYLLNATPVVNDVDFNRTYGIMSNGDWRSLMVAGLGKGGKGYYALDVTHGDKLDSGSVITTESDAATKFLWEFSGDTDMGYTYGNPVITRSATYGWVVFVSSGYNNSTGNGAIWVLNAKTGAVLKKFQIAPSCGASTSTYTCVVESGLSSSNPLNLGKMTSFVTSVATEEVRSIYAGDMQGNLWRLDVDQADKANWTIQKLAQFTSPSGTGPYGNTRQPITTEPTVNWDKGKDLRWVFVGTGEDLSGLDRDSTKAQANQVQSFYAIADGQGATPLSLGTPITRNDLVSTPPSSVASVDISGKRGWYMDLAASVPTSGSTLGTLAERVVLKPTANFGVVLYATNTPTLDLCSPGYSSKLYARGYLYGKTGASYLTNASGAAVPYFSSAAGNAADPTLVQLADKSVVFQSCDLTGKCTTSPFMNAGSMSQSRVSWRELINN